MYVKKKIIFLLIFWCSFLYSQIGGKNTLSFLNIASSPRQIALGGKVITLTNDVDQPTWNPSIISKDIHKQLSVNYTSYLSDIQIGAVSYAYELNSNFGTLQSNITYVSYGELIRADEEGNENGIFNANDIAFSIGYARKILKSGFSYGTNVRFIHSNIDSFNTSAIAIDIGFTYFTPNKPFIFSIVARNIAHQLNSYNGTREKLPFEIAIGGSYKLEKMPLRWFLSLDNLQKWEVAISNPSNQIIDLEGNVTEEKISFLNNAFRHVSIGAELFPESVINLRIGYNFRRGQELKIQNSRSFAGLSFGFGLRMNSFKFNYAYSKFHSASNVSTVSLQIDLNKKRKI